MYVHGLDKILYIMVLCVSPVIREITLVETDR